jgi:hypothetical protein
MKKSIAVLCSLFLLLIAFSAGCYFADSDQSCPPQSTRSLAELLAMDSSKLTEADIDRLNLFTGSMSGEQYTAKYGSIAQNENSRNILDDITSEIWGAYDLVNIPGAVCADGSPYKIFVMKSTGLWNWLMGYNKNLIVYLEPGGACWDYASCTGQAGIRGASNLHGIPDNYMNLGAFIDSDPNNGGSPMAAISPLILRNHPAGDDVETSSWNKVFVPYCTGDVHCGNKVTTYTDPTGVNPPVTINHKGAVNIEKVIAYLKTAFPGMNKVMITGCSAGGVGSLANYHFFRKALAPKKLSILLDDSGPVFFKSGYQYYLHQEIQNLWNTNYLMNKLIADIPGFNFNGDFGQIHAALAYKYPNDKLGLTLFKRDRNFSAYSYARFYGLDESDPVDAETILSYWASDIANMLPVYRARSSNMSYYVPYMRSINESHCTCIVEWTGTEYLNTGIDVGTYIKDMLDGGSVTSYEEPVNPSDADVNDFWMDLVNLLL